MKKILFIEDESALQKALGDVLSQEGYKMISALDGKIGMRLAKTENPDLILLDLILPRMLGLDVLKSLKKDSETKWIPVIVLTNREDLEMIEQAMTLGASSYLIKANYSLEELLKKIEQKFQEE